MKITIECTTEFVDVDNVRSRIWVGTTDTGIKVTCLVTRVAVFSNESQAIQEQFCHELLECEQPPNEVFNVPLRLLL